MANHSLPVTGEWQRAVCHSDCGNAANSSWFGFPDSMMSHQLVNFTSSRPAKATGESSLQGLEENISINTHIARQFEGRGLVIIVSSLQHDTQKSTQKARKLPGILRKGRASEFRVMNNARLLPTENCSGKIYEFHIRSVYPSITHR